MTKPIDDILLRSQSDEDFLAGCRWEAFRGPGPGGQKRNKTSSAVRITHVATNLSATAGESRSQSENRARALKRLRLQIVLERRVPIDPANFSLPNWFARLMKNQRIDLSPKHESYLPALGLMLDVLSACGWSVSDAARALDISTANFSRFLRQNDAAWAKVNQMRAAVGLKPLIG